MTNRNRKKGNTFEKRLCKLFAEQGFWVHNLAQNASGQPFDVIAVRDGTAVAIDCKVCSNDTFDPRRIEENQAYAMTVWHNKGNGGGWFAIELSNKQIVMLSFIVLESLTEHHKLIKREDILMFGITLDVWFKRYIT